MAAQDFSSPDKGQQNKVGTGSPFPSEQTGEPSSKISGSVPIASQSPPAVPPPPPATQTLPPMPTPGKGQAEPEVTGGSAENQGKQPEQPITEVATPPPPKKGFPKIIVVLLFLLVILGGAYLLAKNFLFKEAPGGKVNLTWWGLWEEDAAVAQIIDDYERVNPNVKITYQKQAQQDYRERLTNVLAAGEGPDIFRFHNSWVPMFRKELDALPSSVMSQAEFTQTFYPVALADLRVGGDIVGLPLEYDGLVLYVNEEIFEASVKTPPTTWDELRKTATDLTIKDEQGLIKQAGIALGRTENVDHWEEILALMMLQNGVNLANPQGDLAEDALRFFTLFSSTDEVWEASLPPSTVAFATGKLAMYIGPSWRAFEIQNINPGLKFRTHPVPQLPKASPDEADITYATYWVEGVWARGENRQAAWDFLNYLVQRETLEKFYKAASSLRLFGEPYPRVEMAELLIDHPILGAIIEQAIYAQSWYLASRTFDGPTGINSQISSYFEDAVNAVNTRQRVDKALETSAVGISQVLSQYQIR